MISIIIPTLNEAKSLPATLQRVFQQVGEFEVIVADGGSEDSTIECCKKYKSVKTINVKRGRASQMNAGAALAKGEWLLFLHADALLPMNALSNIEAQQSQAGGFTHQFSGRRWGLRVVSWLHNFRFSRTGVLYGDQAMFIKTAMFNKLGGFPGVEYLEDLLFGEKLATTMNPVLLEQVVISDSRKFEQQGVWLSLFRVIKIQLHHELKWTFRGQRFFANVR